MNYEIHELFPVPVMVFKRFANTSAEESLIKDLEYRSSISNKTSIINDVLNLPSLESLKTFCNESLHTYCNEILKTNQFLRITTSWSTSTEAEQEHHRHNHKNSILSGVYYWQSTVKEPIIFEDPNADKKPYDLNTRIFTNLNSENYALGTDADCLLIFPSWLYHNVGKTNNDRFSLAFNTFFEKDSYYGNKKYLTQIDT